MPDILTCMRNSKRASRRGFTIVELLVVIVVIAILASISIVSYNGITRSAKETALKADLKNGATQLYVIQLETGSYPADTDDLKKSDDTVFTYNTSGNAFCLAATNNTLSGVSFYITDNGSITEGECPQPTVYMQTVTGENCSATRTLAIDARDSRTYWIQKLADGNCWMLTNLAYAGGGDATYNDAKTLQDGTEDTATSLVAPKYYIHANAYPTTEPAAPSASTDGGVTEPQYGYLYNWCAAMGVQLSTSACANATSPAPDTTLSICPAGWRLPTATPSTGEFPLLTTAINATNNAAGVAILQSVWFAQYSGSWFNGFSGQGSNSGYWSSTQAAAATARFLQITTGVSPQNTYNKANGFSIRCVAA